MIAAAAALLLVVELAGNHHRPQPPPPQPEISMGKKYCPTVNMARASGMTDDQIIAMAVGMGVSPQMIVWAQKNCIVAKRDLTPANGPRSSLQDQDVS